MPNLSNLMFLEVLGALNTEIQLTIFYQRMFFFPQFTMVGMLSRVPVFL